MHAELGYDVAEVAFDSAPSNSATDELDPEAAVGLAHRGRRCRYPPPNACIAPYDAVAKALDTN